MRRIALLLVLLAACRHEASVKIKSPAFNDGDPIPRQYTCDGENAPPPLWFNGAPASAKTLMYGVQETNDFGKRGYGGPCPPGGEHRYVFHLYALDGSLSLPPP